MSGRETTCPSSTDVNKDNEVLNLGDMGLTPLFIVIGSFYMFAGVVAGRAVLMDAVLDMALSGLTARPRESLDVQRSGWMLLGACVVGASGVLLAGGSIFALPVFLLSNVLQVLHFAFLSPKRYDVDNPVSPQGRQQSLNAFALYMLVTCLVVWATFSGQLKSFFGLNIYVLSALGAAWLGATVWSFHWLLTLGDRPKEASFEGGASHDEAAEDLANQKWAATAEFILSPGCDTYPLIDRQSGCTLDFLEIEALNLPGDIVADMMAYSRACLAVIDRNDPLMVTLFDAKKADALGQSGERLFLQLQDHFGNRVTFEPEFRPNYPKRLVARLNIHGAPWTTGVFENWPVTSQEPDIWLNTLGISMALIKDIEDWVQEANTLYTHEPEKVYPLTAKDALAQSVKTGRALAVRMAQEFAATGRGGIPITYHPFGAAPEEIKL